MRALVNTPGGPNPVEPRDVPEPIPAPNEALVAVRAFSLNRGELRSFVNNEEGWIPGQDISGVVLKAAANGLGPPAGARIVGLTDEFGWAERVAVAAHRMAILPDNVSFAQAATLPVAGLTALRCVRLGGAIAGRNVLITGGAGGVGTIAIQIAAHSGAHVTAVVGRPERAAGLKSLGAEHVAVGIENAIGRHSLILESSGGTGLSQALQRIEPNGTIVVYGNSSGEASTISFGDFRAAQNSRIQSFFYFTSGPEEQFAPDLSLLVSFIANGSLHPVIGVERDWSEIGSVAEELRRRQVPGKAVFRVGDR